MIELKKTHRFSRAEILNKAKIIGGYGGALREVCHTIKKYVPKSMVNNCARWGDIDKAKSDVTPMEDAMVDATIRMLEAILPKNAVIVPVPGHTGDANVLASVLNAKLDYVRLVDEGRNIRVANMLKCDPHPSAYMLKKAGEVPAPIKMRIDDVTDYYDYHPYIYNESTEQLYVMPGYEYFLFDNVIDTGATMAAALEVLPFATPLAIAASRRQD